MGFYKRNNDGTIQSRSKQVDDTWLPLTDLETMEDGAYATYYNQDGTIDLVKEAVIANENTRIELQAIRDKALSDSEYTLTDGSIYQTRPSDLSNFEVAINKGVSKTWILKNNTTRLTTVEELVEILTNGVSQAEAIWDNYAEELSKI